jgi:hypothetical protein
MKAMPTDVLPGSRLTPAPREQSMLPWIVACAALLLVAVLGIGITILIFANSKSSDSNGTSGGRNYNATPRPTSSPSVIDLTGTKWTQTSTISQMKEITFNSNGTLNNDSGDTWKQDGNHVTLSMTNGYAIYQGTITGDRIDYKAHNQVNLDWTGTFYRAR